MVPKQILSLVVSQARKRTRKWGGEERRGGERLEIFGTILSYDVQRQLPAAPSSPMHTEEMAALLCEGLSQAARQRM